MLALDQRAHDLAVAQTMQILQIKNNAVLNSGDDKIELHFDTNEVLDIYCKLFDSFCRELTNRL